MPISLEKLQKEVEMDGIVNKATIRKVTDSFYQLSMDLFWQDKKKPVLILSDLQKIYALDTDYIDNLKFYDFAILLANSEKEYCEICIATSEKFHIFISQILADYMETARGKLPEVDSFLNCRLSGYLDMAINRMKGPRIAAMKDYKKKIERNLTAIGFQCKNSVKLADVLMFTRKKLYNCIFYDEMKEVCEVIRMLFIGVYVLLMEQKYERNEQEQIDHVINGLVRKKREENGWLMY